MHMTETAVLFRYQWNIEKLRYYSERKRVFLPPPL